MHARHYSPTLGRFLTPDPDGSESNLYAYTANNPVTELDPDGTCFILCAVVNAVLDTAIYLATTDSSEWSVGEIAVTAATGAATGFLGVGLLSKVTKVGSLAEGIQIFVPPATPTAPATQAAPADAALAPTADAAMPAGSSDRARTSEADGCAVAEQRLLATARSAPVA